MNLFTKIAMRFGYIPKEAIKKSSTWSKVWLKANESSLLGNNITKPYSQHWAVYLAISKIATNIARVPFVIYQGEKQIENHPILDLLSQPNPQLSRFQLWEATAVFLNLKGEAFWFLGKSRGQAAGTTTMPAMIWVFHPDRFRPAVNNDGNIIGWVYKGKIPLKLEEVIHFKFFNPYDDIRGLAPLESARITMETDYDALLYNRNFFKNSAEPSGILRTENSVTDDQFKRLLAMWEGRHKGQGRAHKVALLEGGLEYQKIGVSQRDMEFLEQRKFSLEEILGVYGVPKSIALTQDLRYATAMVQRKAFWIDTLLPQMKLITEKLQSEFFSRFAPGLTGIFDTDGIEELRDDLKTKTEVAEKLWKLGFTGNEINQRLDLGFEEQPWRDTWWAPINLLPVQDAGPQPKALSVETPQLKAPSRGDVFRNQFLAAQRSVENLFYSKIKRFFFEQRGRVLSLMNKSIKGALTDEQEFIARIGADWKNEDDKLKLVSKPLYEEAITTGAQIALDTMDLGIDFDLINPESLTNLEARINRLSKINDTMWEAIRSEIHGGMTEGESLDQVSDRIRRVYNMASNRSKTIARTETAGAMNEAGYDQYKLHGVKQKRWLVAHDENVRESHMAAGEQGRIKIADTFSNGLQYPGDPNGGPEEVINCRCTLEPIIKEI